MLQQNVAIEYFQVTDEMEVLGEGLVRLAPREHHSVNFLGQYLFALSETLALGQLRLLRAPGEGYGAVAQA